MVTAFGFGAWLLPYLVWGSNNSHQVTCFMFVFLTLALPKLFYFAEYEILTGHTKLLGSLLIGGCHLPTRSCTRCAPGATLATRSWPGVITQLNSTQLSGNTTVTVSRIGSPNESCHGLAGCSLIPHSFTVSVLHVNIRNSAGTHASLGTSRCCTCVVETHCLHLSN